MNRFAGKVVLVTGASRGIGRAIAEGFLEEGARVALLSRSLEQLEILADVWNAKNRRALAVSCDVRDRESVSRAIETVENSWGKLHVVVNNAGASGRTPLEGGEQAFRRWERILQTNLTGAFLVSQQALELMSSGDGRIINISSVLGRKGEPAYAAYCASKHGLIGLTRALALELASRSITVNAVCPGWVDTEMATEGIRETAEAIGVPAEAFRDRAIADTPLKRFVEASEVAKLVLYLASEDAAAITGQTFNICGGTTMN